MLGNSSPKVAIEQINNYSGLFAMNDWKCFVLNEQVSLEYYMDQLVQMSHLGKSTEIKYFLHGKNMAYFF